MQPARGCTDSSKPIAASRGMNIPLPQGGCSQLLIYAAYGKGPLTLPFQSKLELHPNITILPSDGGQPVSTISYAGSIHVHWGGLSLSNALLRSAPVNIRCRSEKIAWSELGPCGICPYDQIQSPPMSHPNLSPPAPIPCPSGHGASLAPTSFVDTREAAPVPLLKRRHRDADRRPCISVVCVMPKV